MKSTAVRSRSVREPASAPLARTGHDASSAPVGRAGHDASGTDIYVLYRVAVVARHPFVADWVLRHQLSSGFSPTHAARYPYVVVIGTREGLALPSGSQAVYIDPDVADRMLQADPRPERLFKESLTRI